jgi:hypothetical protein
VGKDGEEEKKFVVLKNGISYISSELVYYQKIESFYKGKSEIDIKEAKLEKYELLLLTKRKKSFYKSR